MKSFKLWGMGGRCSHRPLICLEAKCFGDIIIGRESRAAFDLMLLSASRDWIVSIREEEANPIPRRRNFIFAEVSIARLRLRNRERRAKIRQPSAPRLRSTAAAQFSLGTRKSDLL
jgi:hypothetical protein